MQESLTFDDVLIVPQFSMIRSRKDVSTAQAFAGDILGLPIISSNMDSVTGEHMARAMLEYGAQAALHRFCSIEDNIKMFKNSNFGPVKPYVSIGIGNAELERGEALFKAGAEHIIIDVAHGAAMHVVEQYDKLRELVKYNCQITVGNFDNAASIYTFNQHVRSQFEPDAFKVGIGPGSMCTTRIVTGCGGGSFTALQSCSTTGFPIIADGGIRNSGDLAKALAAGATTVMIGKLFAGCSESAAERTNIRVDHEFNIYKDFKKYRGSASLDSYKVQNKVAEHRAPEGEATLVPYTGSVKDTLTQLEAGLRSSMSYVGAQNLDEFRKKAQFVKVSTATSRESSAHGKRE